MKVQGAAFHPPHSGYKKGRSESPEPVEVVSRQKQSSLGDGRSRQGQSSVESRQSSAGDGARRTAGVEQATSRSEQTALSRSSDAEE